MICCFSITAWFCLQDEREDLPFPNDAVPFALPSDFVDDAGDEDEDERDEKPLRECKACVFSSHVLAFIRRFLEDGLFFDFPCCPVIL